MRSITMKNYNCLLRFTFWTTLFSIFMKSINSTYSRIVKTQFIPVRAIIVASVRGQSRFSISSNFIAQIPIMWVIRTQSVAVSVNVVERTNEKNAKFELKNVSQKISTGFQAQSPCNFYLQHNYSAIHNDGRTRMYIYCKNRNASCPFQPYSCKFDIDNLCLKFR